MNNSNRNFIIPFTIPLKKHDIFKNKFNKKCADMYSKLQNITKGS